MEERSNLNPHRDRLLQVGKAADRMAAGPQSVRAAQIESYARRAGTPEGWVKIPHPAHQRIISDMLERNEDGAQYITGSDMRRDNESFLHFHTRGVYPHDYRGAHLPRPTSPTPRGHTRSGKGYGFFSNVKPNPES